MEAKQPEITDAVRRKNLQLDLQLISADADGLATAMEKVPVLREEVETISTIRHYLGDLRGKYSEPAFADEGKNVTGKTLQTMIAAVRLTPDKFAVSIGVKPSQLRRFLKKSSTKPINDKIFLMKLAAYAPNVILSRIAEMNAKLQELKQFGPILQKVGEELHAMEKEEAKVQKWKDRFGDDEDDDKEETEEPTKQGEEIP